MSDTTADPFDLLQPLGGGMPGWRLGVLEDHYVDIIIGARQTRIVLQPVDAPPRSYTRFWCYFGDNRDLLAIAAARLWLLEQTPEPRGYSRSWTTNQ